MQSSSLSAAFPRARPPSCCIEGLLDVVALLLHAFGLSDLACALTASCPLCKDTLALVRNGKSGNIKIIIFVSYPTRRLVLACLLVYLLVFFLAYLLAYLLACLLAHLLAHWLAG